MHLEEMLKFNQNFVQKKEYQQYETDSYPNKRMVVFTCMESRLVELLPKALNIQNGDVKMIKNAGAMISKPFDSIMKSILIAVYELRAEEVVVIGHYDCGMSKSNTHTLLNKMMENGVTDQTLQTIEKSGIDLHKEFKGFQSVEESIQQSVQVIKTHPLLPKNIKVYGLVIDPGTGKVDLISGTLEED